MVQLPSTKVRRKTGCCISFAYSWFSSIRSL